MRIGVLGGGQLGRMLGQAGASLGLSFVFLEPADECPAAATGDRIRAGYDDPAALHDLASRSDIVTYEFENVPLDAVRTIAALRPVHPAAASLEAAQDRLNEKTLFGRLGIPTTRFEPVGDGAGLEPAVERLGFPSVLKTRRLGYDGRGQWVLRGPADVASAREALGGSPAILEEFVRFERELSMIAVRGQTGEIAFYPPIENHHRDGILRVSRAPAPGITPALRASAEDYARRLIETLGHVGVLALELFQSGDALVANEIAPRVHNTGHWTIEGARTSQFENHLRAIAGMPLGPTDARGHSAMVNLIGTIPDLSPLAGTPGVHVHRYGKQPRPGRKLGHITVCADDAGTVEDGLAELWTQLGPAAGPLPPRERTRSDAAGV